MALTDRLGLEGMTYICGRPFTSEDGQHNPGEEVPNAPTFPLLESLVNSGFLYRVYEGNGYDRLPPHVFNAVQTRREAQAAIEGDESRLNVQNDWSKSGATKQAEREAEVQVQLHQMVLDHANQAHQQ